MLTDNLSREEFERDLKLKDTNWFYRGMLEIWRTFLASGIGEGAANGRALDAGCGIGGKTPSLKAWAEKVYAMDLSADALGYARPTASWPLTRGSVERLPYRDGVFGIVNSFDVLEHIDDDEGALRECNRVLRTGGILVLALPAFQSLWSEHDVANFHRRRYERSDLRRKLEEAGFAVRRLSYANFFLFPLVWLVRRYEAMRGSSASGAKRTRVEDLPPVVNAALLGLLRLESWLIQRVNFPCGVALLGIAEKRRS